MLPLADVKGFLLSVRGLALWTDGQRDGWRGGWGDGQVDIMPSPVSGCDVKMSHIAKTQAHENYRHRSYTTKTKI